MKRRRDVREIRRGKLREEGGDGSVLFPLATLCTGGDSRFVRIKTNFLSAFLSSRGGGRNFRAQQYRKRISLLEIIRKKKEGIHFKGRKDTYREEEEMRNFLNGIAEEED